MPDGPDPSIRAWCVDWPASSTTPVCPRSRVEHAGLKIRVSRTVTAAPVAMQVAAPAAPAPAPAAVAAAAPVFTGETLPPGEVIKSPMVGTVYLQSQPGTPPFVKVGDTVTQGQTLLIIEAMKTMNPIPAPKAGVVRAIMAEDGEPVEFGEPLAVIE